MGSAGVPLAHSALLKTTAEQLMQQAQAGPPTRDTALALLAADALITFACEAAGEADPRSLLELA